jgi:hypothetical protein
VLLTSPHYACVSVSRLSIQPVKGYLLNFVWATLLNYTIVTTYSFFCVAGSWRLKFTSIFLNGVLLGCDTVWTGRMAPNVSGKRNASIFRSDVMKTVSLSEPLESVCGFTWRLNPEEQQYYPHRCENLKFHIPSKCFHSTYDTLARCRIFIFLKPPVRLSSRLLNGHSVCF